MESRYAKNAGAVCSLRYHVVWCPKYRRPVLTDAIEVRLRGLLAEKSAERGMTIHALEVMPDHVHLFVESDPTMRVAEIANGLKGYTSRVPRGRVPFAQVQAPDTVESQLLREQHRACVGG